MNGFNRPLVLKSFVMIGLVSAFTLVLGALLVIQWNQRQSLAHQKIQSEEARIQNRLLTQNFWSSVEKIRSEVAQISGAPTQATYSTVLHWSQLELKSGLLPVWKRSERNPSWPLPTGRTGLDPRTFEENYLQSAVRMLSEPGTVSELSRTGVKVVEVREERDLKPRYLAFAFKLHAESPIVDLALVDPVQAFPVFRNFNRLLGENSHRAYLLSSQGVVLAHSTVSYVSSDFGSLPVFKMGINRLQPQLVRAEAFQAADHLPALTSYSQLGTLSLYAVIENVVLHPGGEFEQLWNGFKGHLFEVFALFLIWGATALSFSFWTARQAEADLNFNDLGDGGRVNPENEHEFDLEALSQPTLPSLSSPHAPVPPPALEVRAVPKGDLKASERSDDLYRVIQQAAAAKNSAAEQVATEKKLQKKSEEEILLHRFEADAARIRDPKIVAEKLVQVAAKICKSPTLYFHFEASTRLAILSTDAGFDQGDAPTTLAFPLTADALLQIEKGDALGEWISLSEYRPLTRAILSKLGVAHFEAWAVTGNRRLQGVLVVLQAGTDSNYHQDSLGRMVRMAGLVYDNNYEIPTSPSPASEAQSEKSRL